MATILDHSGNSTARKKRWSGYWSFLAWLGGTYLLLLLAWIPAGPAYRQAVIKIGNVMVARPAPFAEVSLVAYSTLAHGELPGRVDVAVLVRDLRWVDEGGQKKWLLAKGVSSFFQPYISCAFLVSLVAATPLAWQRRLGLGVSALFLLHVSMLVAVLIDVQQTWLLHAKTEADAGRIWRDLVALLHATVADWPAGVFLVPLLLWAVIAGPALLSRAPTPRNQV